MDNRCLSHVQPSPVQASAACNTKCSQNQLKFILNDVQEQTVQQVHQAQEDLLPLGAAAPLWHGRPGGGKGGRLRGALPGSPLSPLRLPGGGWLSQGTDVTIAAAITTARCRRRLDAPTKFELLWGCSVATPLAP